MVVSPWLRSRATHRAYSELEHDDSNELTWSAAGLSFSTTPSAVMLCTRQIPTHGSGMIAVLSRAPGLVKIISFDLIFWIAYSIAHPACLMPREANLSLRNTNQKHARTKAWFRRIQTTWDLGKKLQWVSEHRV